MANGNTTIIVGSNRQEHSAVFSVCQVLFHTIYNEPIAGDRVHYTLASAFCVRRKDGGLIMKSQPRSANQSFPVKPSAFSGVSAVGGSK